MSDESRYTTVLSRLLDLSQQKTDLRYENPSDVAVAIYLWLLAAKKKALARVGAQTVWELPRYWWAKGMARQILFGGESQAGSTAGQVTTGDAYVSARNDAPERLFPLTSILGGPLFTEQPGSLHSDARADSSGTQLFSTHSDSVTI